MRNTTDRIRPVIVFQILLVSPLGHNCQFQQRFESLSTFSFSINAIRRTFRFCSIRSRLISLATNMTSPRMYHTSTFIPQDTTVLIAGGFNPSSISALITADRFLVTNDSLPIVSTKNMSIARFDHTADLVPASNLVLLSGGTSGTFLPHNTAELFNPISGVTSTISMSTERATHKSAAIHNANKIVLIGGQNSSYIAINTGDVFDGTRFYPVQNTMIEGRVGHTVTYLPTIDKVLITGGSNGNPDQVVFSDTVEFYDVKTNRFQRLANVRMSSRRAGHTATYIPAPVNQVLIVGGGSNETTVLDTFDIFDVSTLKFIKSGTMKEKRTFHTSTLLTNNKQVLLVSGRTSVTDDQLAACELFNPVTMSSSLVECLNERRFFHTATLVPSTGNVFVCGGVDSNKQALASCELLEL